MDETFKVGEIGILQKLLGWPGRYNGEDAEIVGGLEMRLVQFLSGSFGFCPTYLILFQGLPVGVRPENLRKKYPPVVESIQELESVA